MLIGTYNLIDIEGPGTWISFNNNQYYYYYSSNNLYQGSEGNIEQLKKRKYLLTSGKLKNAIVKIKGTEEINIFTSEGKNILGKKINNIYTEVQ